MSSLYSETRDVKKVRTVVQKPINIIKTKYQSDAFDCKGYKTLDIEMPRPPTTTTTTTTTTTAAAITAITTATTTTTTTTTTITN